MSIRHLEIAKEMKRQGQRLKRQGLSERVFTLVDEFNQNRSYKNAIVLAGRLKAIAQACEESHLQSAGEIEFDEKAADRERRTNFNTINSQVFIEGARWQWEQDKKSKRKTQNLKAYRKKYWPQYWAKNKDAIKEKRRAQYKALKSLRGGKHETKQRC